MAGTTGASSPKPSSIVTPARNSDEVANGSAWAREVKDPWDPAILTLDGGGIRGYSSLLIIQRLMREVAKWENKLEAEAHGDKTFDEHNLLPCHYFDYMFVPHGYETGSKSSQFRQVWHLNWWPDFDYACSTTNVRRRMSGDIPPSR